MKKVLVISLLFSSVSLFGQVEHLSSFKKIKADRINEIANMLDDSPRGTGGTYHDRKLWKSLDLKANGKDVIRRADSIMNSPFPEWNDDLYLQFSKTAVRPAGEKMINDRYYRLAPLVWAECLVNNGKYVPEIEKTLKELISHRSWVSPAHDRKLHDFYGRKYSVDLRAAAYAQSLAQTIYMLDDKLSSKLREEICDSLESRIFNPVRIGLEEKRLDTAPWIMKTNNWNSVCFAGVTAAALAVIKDKAERAYFVAAAEYYSQNAMVGYKSDGYCTEGIHYYSFGFGHYIYLREIIYQQTKGQIDLFKRAKVSKLAQFASNIEIINEVYPSYGDCYFGTKPLDVVVWYCNKVYGRQSNVNPQWRFGELAHDMVLLFPNQGDKPAQFKSFGSVEPQIRTYFNEGGVFVVRPYADDYNKSIAAAFKGGNNAEHHNHNDIGSYTIVKGKEVLAGDQGGPLHYDGNMATSRRYEFKSLSSYGHPVPLVNGICQKPGADAKAREFNLDYQVDKDAWTIDISSAYDVPELMFLTRTFAYDRSKNGEVTVFDRFGFKEPCSFETAITTNCKWEKINDNTLRITGKNETVYVKIIPSNNEEVEINSEVIEVNAPPYTRIGIKFKNKVLKGEIKLVYSTNLE